MFLIKEVKVDGGEGRGQVWLVKGAALWKLQGVASQELCWWSPDAVCDRSNWVITNHYLITTHNIDGLFGPGM